MSRPEIVKTFDLEFFALEQKKWDNRHYPYQEVQSYWETLEQAKYALDNIPIFQKGEPRITKVCLNVDQHGRVYLDRNLVVYEDSKWHEAYDPRMHDPEWNTYLRLKSKFDGEDSDEGS